MQPDQDRLRADILKTLNELYLYGFTSAKHQERDDEIKGITQGQAIRELQALIAREVRLAKLKARREVRGDYLFMMNTHDFGRPFSYEKILQITKEAYSELEAELSKEAQ